MIKAIVFDFDGLILDTETQVYLSLQKIYEKYQVELPMELWSKAVGTRDDFFDPIKYLEEKSGEKIDVATFNEERGKLLKAFIDKEEILPGVKAILETAQQLGIKIGLATSSNRGWAAGHLERLGLLDYFECIRTADDVQEVKPNPELYLQAVQCLNVKPEEAIAFEDSLNGALAAKKAGLYCVVVPNQVTKDMLFEDVDQLLNSLEDTTLEKLIEAFSKK